jgi:FixJ family two-component response regulator
MAGGGTHRRMVCLVDDDVSFREALEGLINAFGYATRAFGSAEDFLRCAPLAEIRCLVLDVRLGGMDGLELQSHLRAHGWATPVIFISSQCDARTRARAMDAGAVGFLSKPFERDALISLIEAAADPASRT